MNEIPQKQMLLYINRMGRENAYKIPYPLSLVGVLLVVVLLPFAIHVSTRNEPTHYDIAGSRSVDVYGESSANVNRN